MEFEGWVALFYRKTLLYVKYRNKDLKEHNPIIEMKSIVPQVLVNTALNIQASISLRKTSQSEKILIYFYFTKMETIQAQDDKESRNLIKLPSFLIHFIVTNLLTIQWTFSK